MSICRSSTRDWYKIKDQITKIVKIMPRLIGKPSKAPVYVGLAIVAGIIGVGTLEYLSELGLLPDIGYDRGSIAPRRLSEPFDYPPQRR